MFVTLDGGFTLYKCLYMANYEALRKGLNL